MVRSGGQGGQLPGRHLPGLRPRKEHALVDMRLYLPEEWTKDKKRCKRAGIPKEVGFRTRHELALEMLREHRAVLPHRWVTGDDEMGRNSHFREQLRSLNEQYLLAVPSNTLVRDLRCPAALRWLGAAAEGAFRGADKWMKTAKHWTRIEVRPGEKGPLVVEAVKARVQAKLGRSNGPEETLVIIRQQQGGQTVWHDYCVSNAPFDTPLREFARGCARSTASKNACGGPRAKRAWPSTRFAHGKDGTIIRRSPCLPPGS